MKIRVSLLTILFFAIFSTGAFAAKLEHEHGNNVMVGHFEDDKDDSAIKESDDDIKELSEIHNQSHHIFQAMNHEHKGHHDFEHSGDNDGDDGDDHGHGNQVPLPAAFWLFGPALLGLLGIKRKSA